MSLSNSILKSINEIVHNYIIQISSKYELDANDLLELWEGESNETENKTVNNNKKKPSNTTVINNKESEELNKLTKQKLIELCKSKGKKCTGTKVELISYLLSDTTSSNATTSITTSNATTSNATTSSNITQQELKNNKPVIPKPVSLAISKNKYGNFEHRETSFIFDNKTKKVIGKQNENGTVSELSKDDINLCNKFKFQYILPENLNKKTNLDDIHVDDLDDDEEIIEEEEEIEEELGDEDFDEEIEEEVEEEYEEE